MSYLEKSDFEQELKDETSDYVIFSGWGTSERMAWHEDGEIYELFLIDQGMASREAPSELATLNRLMDLPETVEELLEGRGCGELRLANKRQQLKQRGILEYRRPEKEWEVGVAPPLEGLETAAEMYRNSLGDILFLEYPGEEKVVRGD